MTSFRSSIATTRAALLLVAVLLASACTAPTAQLPQQALSRTSASDTPTVANDHVPLPVERTAPAAPVARTPAPAPVAQDMPRLDTTTAQAMIESLRRIDPTLVPADRQLLRASMTVFTIRLQQKVTAIAATYPSDQPPHFADDQLLQMAYGELNGKSGAEIIAAGQRAASQLPPNLGGSLETLMQHMPANGGGGHGQGGGF